MNNKIVRFCRSSVEKWRTTLLLKTKQEVMQSHPIEIRRGIFQGERLSPLLLWISSSLSSEENKSLTVYGWLEWLGTRGSKKEIPLIFLRNYNYNQNEIYILMF
jgi:hypothetical protein